MALEDLFNTIIERIEEWTMCPKQTELPLEVLNCKDRTKLQLETLNQLEAFEKYSRFIERNFNEEVDELYKYLDELEIQDSYTDLKINILQTLRDELYLREPETCLDIIKMHLKKILEKNLK